MHFVRIVITVLFVVGCPCLCRSDHTLTILSYNIHHGRGGDDQIDLPRIAALIKNARADVVALQEVDRRTQRSGGVDQLAELARLTQLNGAFGKAIDFGGGEYGVAVLSRFPIQESRCHPLPSSAGREQRVALEVRLTPTDMEQPLVVISTHWDHTRDEQDRLAQAEKVMALFGRETLQTIVAGDLNATPESKPLSILSDVWRPSDTALKPTIPAAKPTAKIDYVLIQHDSPFRVHRVEVLGDDCMSDHRAVLADLRYASSQP